MFQLKTVCFDGTVSAHRKYKKPKCTAAQNLRTIGKLSNARVTFNQFGFTEFPVTKHFTPDCTAHSDRDFSSTGMNFNGVLPWNCAVYLTWSGQKRLSLNQSKPPISGRKFPFLRRCLEQFTAWWRWRRGGRGSGWSGSPSRRLSS